MSAKPDDTIICLSANGTTTSESRNSARRMLVATTEGVLDFRRDGHDDPWQLQDSLLLEGQHVSCLVYDEVNDLLFAGMHFEGGVLVSADRGKTWEARNNGLQSGHAYTLLVQHEDGETILNLGTEPVMFYRSFDLGKTWVAYPSCLDVEGKEHWLFPRSHPHIKHIASPKGHRDTIYICVEQGDLLRTKDGGKTWEQIDSMERPDDKFRRDQHRVVFYRDDPNEIFFTTGIGLYHSSDEGKSWERLTDPSHPLAYPDPFFVHPHKDILVMVGAGENPNPKWAAEGTAHPLFMTSRDHGKTWQKAMNGLPDPVPGNLEVAAMHVSDEGGVEFYTGTACGQLYVSCNEGESWHPVAESLLPMSKGPHFRWFLTQEERDAYESKLRAMNAFA